MPFKGPGGNRVMAQGGEYSKLFSNTPAGDHNHPQSMHSGGTTRAEDLARQRRSMGSLENNLVVQNITSPAKTPDDIFKP